MKYPTDYETEDAEVYASSGLFSAIGGLIAVAVVCCLIPVFDAFRAFKRLHPIAQGILVSAVTGVAISLMLFLVAYLILEGIL